MTYCWQENESQKDWIGEKNANVAMANSTLTNSVTVKDLLTSDQLYLLLENVTSIIFEEGGKLLSREMTGEKCRLEVATVRNGCAYYVWYAIEIV